MAISGATEHASTCRICGCARVQQFNAREMMFGTLDVFGYFECQDCGCVQIAEYPSNISKYYPDNYYSFASDKLPQERSLVRVVRRFIKSRLLRIPWFRRYWLRLAANRSWLAGRLSMAIYLALRDRPDARILDVGCGSGQLLRQLRDFGFHAAQGVDPFIAADVMHHGEALVRKASLADMTGSFDCICFHHSLEHMPDQASVLKDARRLLAPGGLLLVRIPVVGGEAWRTYRENWVQLDPPRHYYLHSRNSLALLADQCGLQLNAVFCDSTGFQFWGSELYLRDIPLLDPRSPAVPGASVFSGDQLAGYNARADRLNAANDGDQIVAILSARCPEPHQG